jgi:hypothetical protein
MSLTTAFDALKAGLTDFSKLEVRTFTGDISALIEGATGELDVGAIVDAAVKDGTITLRLYTRLDADGDSDQFFSDGPIDPIVVDAHTSAFRMGQEIRHSYLELFKDVAKRII